jgi:hypothetical protein
MESNYSACLMPILFKASFAYMDVGKGREHDCIDAGGRATQGAVAEERKLWTVKIGFTIK